MALVWHDYVGYLGMALGLLSLSVRTMIPLRLLAMGACGSFATYAFVHDAYPTLIVNLVSLPIHAWRAWEMRQLTHRIAAATNGDLNAEWLKPYMARRTLAAGAALFRKGDAAAELFYIVAGRLRLAELDIEIGPGELVGEIGMFSPTRRRTFGAEAVGDVELLAISESSLKQLYYQNPGFGFYLVQLVTQRLVANLERMEAQVAADRKAA
jgi:hypothetical protein